jgi:NADPH-dependent ferric siderophore reductase
VATPEHDVRVSAVADLTPRMRRVSVLGETLRGLATTPAQEVSLGLRDEAGNPVRRRYTIRTADPDEGRWDIDVVLHGHGPGAAWGESVRVGDQLTFAGPRGRLDFDGAADWHALIADEAGLPAVAALLEAAPPAARIVALLEVADAAEEQPLHSAAAATELSWLRRDGLPAGAPTLFARAIARLDAPDGRGAAIILTESKAAIAVRDALVERGVARGAIQVKGYWNVGRDRPRGAAVDAVRSGVVHPDALFGPDA